MNLHEYFVTTPAADKPSWWIELIAFVLLLAGVAAFMNLLIGKGKNQS